MISVSSLEGDVGDVGINGIIGDPDVMFPSLSLILSSNGFEISFGCSGDDMPPTPTSTPSSNRPTCPTIGVIGAFISVDDDDVVDAGGDVDEDDDIVFEIAASWIDISSFGSIGDVIPFGFADSEISIKVFGGSDDWVDLPL